MIVTKTSDVLGFNCMNRVAVKSRNVLLGHVLKSRIGLKVM